MTSFEYLHIYCAGDESCGGYSNQIDKMWTIFVFSLCLLIEAQSCPLTDEYLSRCHCGILTNGESYIKCEERSLQEMPKFKRSFPYDELILSNNHIKFLTASSFNNIKTIKRITLAGNALAYIDDDLLRLLGNYLEELILTGDTEIDSLEFLTRYPLKKLRVLKLNDFNLNKLNLQNVFLNMTNLETLYLQSCQIRQMPQLSHIRILNLENNFLAKAVFLTSTYWHLNLANNQLSSVILQNNPNIMSLNLSRNFLQEFYSLTISNKNLLTLDLSYNQLSTLDWSVLNENLTSLNLSSNRFKQIQMSSYPKGLSSLELSANQLKTLDYFALFDQLTSFNLDQNPLDCNCHLKWLTNLTSQPRYTCSSPADFQCRSTFAPRLAAFNITYITTSDKTGLLIEWTLIDTYQTLSYLEISVDQMSTKLPFNQTRVFMFDHLQSNKQYYVCLTLAHQYSQDKYCRDVQTENPTTVENFELLDNEIIFAAEKSDHHLYLLLIGTCVGGALTFTLLLTCCYLCYRIRKYKASTSQPVYEQCAQHFPYPMYHCPHHQIIYNSENLSNSTDSSHIDSSLSTAPNNNLKHIYQTIDSQDYHTLRKQHYQVFELWNASLRQKR